jgi:DNA-binding response OmpR family regulator
MWMDPLERSVVVLVNDLMLGERLERGLAALGYQPVLTPATEAFIEAVRRWAPVLALVDTAIRGVDWEAAIRTVARDVPVLAFGSHKDLQARQRALSAGAVHVVANSALVTDLPGLLARYARARG